MTVTHANWKGSREKAEIVFANMVIYNTWVKEQMLGRLAKWMEVINAKKMVLITISIKWCTETHIACEEFYFAQPIKAYENSSDKSKKVEKVHRGYFLNQYWSI